MTKHLAPRAERKMDMKKAISLVMAVLLLAVLAAGCGGEAAGVSSDVGGSVSGSAMVADSVATAEKTTIHIAGLKGPTTMGMVKLMSDADAGTAKQEYQVEVYGTADEIVPKLVSGEIDLAAVPANLASVLYNRTEGAVQVAAVNTLGVLYVVENGDSIHSVEDLRGRTIYSTGKGTTPEYVLNYILLQNGIDPQQDVTIEFKSESTEVAALLAAGSDAVAVLPQPYVTAVQMQNSDVRTALDLSEEWDKVSEDSGLVTGVLVARKEFIEENPGAFADFLADYAASIAYVNANVPEAAELVAQYGIVEKAAVAEKAIPACNIVYLAGPEMQTRLAGYLQVLYDQNPEAVGGALPAEDFYYIAG